MTDRVIDLNRVMDALPTHGQVRLVSVTDRQFGKMEIFVGKKRQRVEDPPHQLLLFEIREGVNLRNSLDSGDSSVSQQRFPANHSNEARAQAMAQSVSQQRFPANHSPSSKPI